MTTNYTDALSNGLVPPSDQGFAEVTINANVQGYWPFSYQGTGIVIPKILEVTCTVSSDLTLPPASQVSKGESVLLRNLGAGTLTLKDYAGTIIGTVVSGIDQFVYVRDNSTEAGTWGILSYGAGISYVSAGQLAGLGTKAFGATLGVASQVISQASSLTLATTHRGQLIEFTTGAATLTLQDTSVYGGDFYAFIKNSGSGTISITPASSEYIDYKVSLGLQPNESLMLISNGNGDWLTVGYGRSTLFQYSQFILDVSAGGTFTLNADQASNKLLTFVGNPAAAITVKVPDIVSIYYAANNLSTAVAVQVKTNAGTGVSVDQSQRAILFCDGTNVTSAQTSALIGIQSLVDGTASAPALNFATTTNTGVYKYSTQGIGLAVAGVAQLYSNGAGVVLPLGGQINGRLGLNGANYGTTGQVLMSAGPGASPTWGDMTEVTSVAYAAEAGTATNVTGTVATTNGGTGIVTYTAGDIIYSSATNVLSRLAKTAAGNVLLSGDVPSWGKVGLTTHVSGTLPVANGGTGATTLTTGGLLRGNGASPVSIASATDIVAAIGGTYVPNATLAGGGNTSSFFTAETTSEGQVGARKSGQNVAYLFNNDTAWGMYSASGGTAFQYTRATGQFTFNGKANSAGYADSAGSAPANGGNADTLDGYHYNNLPYAAAGAYAGVNSNFDWELVRNATIASNATLNVLSNYGYGIYYYTTTGAMGILITCGSGTTFAMGIDVTLGTVIAGDILSNSGAGGRTLYLYKLRKTA